MALLGRISRVYLMSLRPGINLVGLEMGYAISTNLVDIG
jgi:hypothetical protein